MNYQPTLPTYSDIRVKLSSKRLSSTRCQVSFSAEQPELKKNTRGHMLVDTSLTLKEVVEIIKERISMMGTHSFQHHASFYTIGKEACKKSGFIFFEA